MGIPLYIRTRVDYRICKTLKSIHDNNAAEHNLRLEDQTHHKIITG